jgi:CRP/FNR family transcriptional regulator, cyclic AMP receptor protein
MDNEDLLRIERTAEERYIRGRTVIFLFEQKSDYVYVLKSGLVRLLRGSSSGREVTFALINPHEIFGETGLFYPHSTYSHSCEAIEDSSILCFRKADLETIIRTNAEAMMLLYQMQTRRRVEAEKRLADFVVFDVTARLAQLLVSLCETYGRTNKIGTLLKLKVTHQDLANLIGSTRETTTLILSEFRRRGLIDFAGRKIIVLDCDQLQMIEGASYLNKSPTPSRFGHAKTMASTANAV